MEYIAIITKEGANTLAEFPDCPGCQTFAEPGEDIATVAQEALEGWLASSLSSGDTIALPRAKVRLRKGAATISVPVSPLLAVSVQIRGARNSAGLSQVQLAKKVGVSQQQIARLERPGSNPQLETLANVANALGLRLSIEMV